MECSRLTHLELEIREIDRNLQEVLNDRQQLESLITQTKPTHKSKGQKEQKEITEARETLNDLSKCVTQLTKQRQQIIQEMINHEFLLWANDEGPGYFG